MIIFIIRSSWFIIYYDPIFVLNLHSLFDVLSHKLLFFDIPLLCYCINLRSLIMFCLSSGDIHLYLGISLSFSFVVVSELFSGELLETFVMLLVILLPIKPPVASAVFWILLFEVVLSASVANYLAWSRRFWLYLPLKFFLLFLPIFLPYF